MASKVLNDIEKLSNKVQNSLTPKFKSQCPSFGFEDFYYLCCSCSTTSSKKNSFSS